MLQLNPAIPLKVRRGDSWVKALAHVLIDYGFEADLQWTVFLENGECWTLRNQDVRADTNITIGRVLPE
jgi:hypothetical protein